MELAKMKRSMLVLAAMAAVMVGAQSACASEVAVKAPQVKVPSTAAAALAANLIARAERALIDYVPAQAGEQLQTLWIFPTGEANTVFVHYVATLPGDRTIEHLAFVEMNGASIARVQDFTSDAPVRVASSKFE